MAAKHASICRIFRASEYQTILVSVSDGVATYILLKNILWAFKHRTTRCTVFKWPTKYRTVIWVATVGLTKTYSQFRFETRYHFYQTIAQGKSKMVGYLHMACIYGSDKVRSGLLPVMGKELIGTTFGEFAGTFRL